LNVNSGLALEFCALDTLKSQAVFSSTHPFFISAIVCYLVKILLTAIIFFVKVPVLSEQMLSAPPIVSQA
jgi:hypothetical protein